jgi:hypothetical protein
MFVALAVCFAAWGLDVYMPDLSRHASQRGLFERYYALRRPREPGTEENARYSHDPVVAYALNWKGENFYTGSHAAMIDCGPLPYCTTRIADWLGRHAGEHVFVVTERSRVNDVIAMIQRRHGVAELRSDERDNVHFALLEVQL